MISTASGLQPKAKTVMARKFQANISPATSSCIFPTMPDILPALTDRLAGRDTFVVHREDLPDAMAVGDGLIDAFGAEPGDGVIDTNLAPNERVWKL